MTGSEDSAAQLLQIERAFAAPIQAVFDAWTSVDVLRRWWPAGPDWQTVAAEADVRVGGRLRLLIRTPSGETYGGEWSAGLSRSSGGQVFAGQVTMAGWT